MKGYIEINIEDELPPNTDESFICKHKDGPSWFEDKLEWFTGDELEWFTGKEINGGWKDALKSWLKPVKIIKYD